MKIAAKETESFLKKSPVHSGVLLYGQDTGLIRQRADILAKYIVPDLNDPFSVVELSSDTLKDDPARLADELSAMNFGGGKRLVRVRVDDGGAGVHNAVASALETLPSNCRDNAFLLIAAGDLPGTSALRKLFEADKNLAALPCYVEDARDLISITHAELKKYNITYPPEVARYIADHCQGDRFVCLSEIAKFSLYLGDNRTGTLEDAEAAIGVTTESTLDDICNAVAEGRQHLLENHLRKAFMQGAVPVMVLRAVQRHFLRLQRTASMMNNGSNPDQAMGALRPPVFWKQKDSFARGMMRWHKKSSKLSIAISTLYQAEISCKSTGANDELACSRALMQIAAM